MHGLAVIHQRRHCLSVVIWRRDAFVTYLLSQTQFLQFFNSQTEGVMWHTYAIFEFTTSGLDFLGFDFLGPYKATWSTSLLPFSFNLITSVFGCSTSHGRTVTGSFGGATPEKLPRSILTGSADKAPESLCDEQGLTKKRRRFIENQQRLLFTTTESVIWCNVPNSVASIRRDELFLFCVQKFRKGVLTRCSQRFTFTPQVQHAAIQSSCDVLTCHFPGHTCAQALTYIWTCFCLNVAFMIFYRLRLRGKRLCFVRFLVYKINTYSCSFIWSCLGHTKHWPVVTWTRRSWTIVSLNHVRDPLDSSAATLKRSACAHCVNEVIAGGSRPGPIRHWLVETLQRWERTSKLSNTSGVT